MVLRMRPGGDHDPLHRYAPAFDISNFMPGLLRKLLDGLREENWPDWMRRLGDTHDLSTLDRSSEACYGALHGYIRALKLMQTDPDIATIDQAFARTGFDQVDPLLRAVVMARVMDYVTGYFLAAIKDATVYVEGGTPVRADVQAAVDAVEELIKP